MKIFKTTGDVSAYIEGIKQAKSTVGFVPTMGALHAGHISLIKQAREDGGIIVCSIFVNPTQFNDKKDLEKYPVTTEADIELLLEADCDVLFLPSVQEMYPEGTEAGKMYDFGYLETILEGAQRPGHFRGVGQIVSRLLEAIRPNKLYIGQKDYQQCMVITKLAKLMGLNELKVIICPTNREADGLAMSSRNRRLTEPQRALAGVIYQCLVSIQGKKDVGNFEVIQKECIELLSAKGFAPEYVSLADARDLTLLDNYKVGTPMVALIAARLGDVRLIDNILV